MIEEVLKGLLADKRRMPVPDMDDYRLGYVNALSDVAAMLGLTDLARALAKGLGN